MNYKDKVLMTLFTTIILFGWLYVENITPPVEELSTGQYVDDIWIEHPPKGSEVYVLVNETIDEMVIRCKTTPSCSKLAEAIVYEARSESLRGRYAVASVILNRVDSNRFPDTIEAVITQSKQFSYLADMQNQSTPTKQDWYEGYSVAYNTMKKKINRVTIADHYLNPDEVKRIPLWARVYNKVEVIGNHHFFVSK